MVYVTDHSVDGFQVCKLKHVQGTWTTAPAGLSAIAWIVKNTVDIPKQVIIIADSEYSINQIHSVATDAFEIMPRNSANAGLMCLKATYLSPNKVFLSFPSHKASGISELMLAP